MFDRGWTPENAGASYLKTGASYPEADSSYPSVGSCRASSLTPMVPGVQLSCASITCGQAIGAGTGSVWGWGMLVPGKWMKLSGQGSQEVLLA
jgi:hypothetical protein